VTRHLFENGKLPAPLFDSCPACKTEWAFDFTGGIYPCTATVGKEDERIGSFYPSRGKNTDRIREWESRDVTMIKACHGCSLRLACGGGCGAVAKNKNGDILTADCRPIAGLVSLGISYYFDKQLEKGV
jgi:uncharacterized protein